MEIRKRGRGVVIEEIREEEWEHLVDVILAFQDDECVKIIRGRDFLYFRIVCPFLSPQELLAEIKELLGE